MNAISGGEVVIDLQRTCDQEIQVLEFLASSGFFSRSTDRKWSLTAYGKAAIVACNTLSDPELLALPESDACSDFESASVWELIVMMSQRGWEHSVAK
eukprot:6793196-Pyramimonas_sp.AAC.1